MASLSVVRDTIIMSGRPISMNYFVVAENQQLPVNQTSVGIQQFQTPTNGRVETCQIQCQIANAGPLQTIWPNASEARLDVFQVL